MTDDDKVLERASEVLGKYRIGEIVVELIDGSYRLQSTQSIEFTKCQSKVSVNDDLKKAVTIGGDGHEIVLGFSDFRGSYAPDDTSSYADAYIYFDKTLVLHTGATQDYGEYSDTIRVNTYAFSLKSFKAGPWMELLGKWRDELFEDSKQREEKKRQAEVAKQAQKIDLGDY